MQVQSSINFTGENHYGYRRDGNGIWQIKSVYFDNPLPLNRAIDKIRTDNTAIDMLSAYKFFAKKTLNQIYNDLLANDKLKSIKVKGMIDYGQTAFVFETEDGDILKITNRDHFLGRKPEDFDAPIRYHSKLSPKSFCHCYIEEKMSHDITKEEVEEIIENIRQKGYKIVDFRNEQLGKTKDGRVLLIDPECARKNNIIGLLKQKFMKIISFIKMAK